MSVSAIIPVWNGKRFIPSALGAVCSQGREILDIIVVDDGSSDCRVVSEVARALLYDPSRAFAVLEHPARRGHGPALETGVKYAGGTHLAFLDVDDIWMPEKTEEQLAWLELHPEYGGVVCNVQEYTGRFEGKTAGGTDVWIQKKRGEPKVGRLFSALLIRRDAFFAVGPPDGAHGAGITLEWFARAEERGVKIGCVDQVLCHRTIHGENYGIREKDAQGDYVKTLKKILDRRRGVA